MISSAVGILLFLNVSITKKPRVVRLDISRKGDSMDGVAAVRFWRKCDMRKLPHSFEYEAGCGFTTLSNGARFSVEEARDLSSPFSVVL